ncbi:MAG: response regulator [Bacillota bacterium]
MNVLIVDDEQHVRDAIKLLVDWDSFGIHNVWEAENGQAAIDMFKQYKPEIIMTDMMMPVKNGVDLLEWLQLHSPYSKKIVISGHDDFALVRNTIKFGGMDYLLKPIDPVQLNETLAKAKESWETEELARQQIRKRNIQVNQLKPVYWDKLLSNMISEPNCYSSIQDDLRSEFGITKEMKHCHIAILSIDTMERVVMNKFRNHRVLLFFSLANICNEFLRKKNTGFAFRYWNSDSEIILLCWQGFDKLNLLLAQINEGIYAALRGRFDFGIGTMQLFPNGIQQSYREAQTALKQRNMLEKTTWLHGFEAKDSPLPITLHLTDYSEKFRLAVLSSNADEIHGAVEEWILAVKQLTVITIEQLDLWRHEYTVLRSKWLKSLSPDNYERELTSEKDRFFTVLMDEHGRLSIELWQKELEESLIQLSNLITKQQHREKNVIYDVIQYIENRYQQEITLQDIANQFFLSREYISRKFKQVTGENLSDYLVRIRIEKAKLLLLNPNLKISQIAQMVGYADEKYFSKVFKKMAGQSPNQFRK